MDTIITVLCLSSWPAAIFTETFTSNTLASHYMSADSLCTADSLLQNGSPLARCMTLHHGLFHLCDDPFTDIFFSWFQASYQASLKFCLCANLTSEHKQLGTNPWVQSYGYRPSNKAMLDCKSIQTHETKKFQPNF